MRFDAERLMSLLPAVYRIRDADRGELRALLEVLAQQIGVLEEDLDQLYDDQFVETAASWAVPYIGDLLDVTPLFDGDSAAGEALRALFPDLNGPRFVPPLAQRSRAGVARAIYYRKRKATPGMLAELAADVTGWPARVVEFFQLLRWTQCVRNHLRMFNKGCPDLRDSDALHRLNGPFDTIPHAVDVRSPSQLEGWYETRNVGFFLWRLRSYSLHAAPARQDVDFRYRANRLGIDVPLFMRSGRGETGGLGELHAPAAIRPSLFIDDIRRHRTDAEPASDIYGIPVDPAPDLQRSLSIRIDGIDIPPQKICPGDLSAWRQPNGAFVGVDVRTGRIALGKGFTNPADVRVSYHYGFSSDLGGGTYSRASWLIKRLPSIDSITVAKGTAFPTLRSAIDEWATRGRLNTIITVTADETYDEPDELLLDPPVGGWLAIEAEDGAFPHVNARKPIKVKCGDNASVTFSGLLIEGSILISALAGRLRLLHTTIVSSGGVAIRTTVVGPPDTLSLEGAFSIIVGSIRLQPNGRGISLYDSVVDAGSDASGSAIRGTNVNESAPALHVERSTILGDVVVRELPMASETIFAGSLDVLRRQQGCARFCFIRRGSRTPHRYRCQPDLAIRELVDAEEKRLGRVLLDAEWKPFVDAVVPWLVPSFTSIRYGDPGYAQLHLDAPRQLARGAEDGSEIGVFCHLKQPQRENNLRTRLGEYLPFGLQPGIIFVT
jgi:hypothetical protein